MKKILCLLLALLFLASCTPRDAKTGNDTSSDDTQLTATAQSSDKTPSEGTASSDDTSAPDTSAPSTTTEEEIFELPEEFEEETLAAGGGLSEMNTATDKSGSSSPDDWSLKLVNVSNPILQDYDIETSKAQNSYLVDSRIVDTTKAMISDAQKDGVSLVICSAYRTVEKQKQLYSNKVNEYINNGKSKDEAEKIAGTIVAVPGTSEHHTGLAVDIVTATYQMLDEGFAKTDAFKWLNENAAEYGFVLRFPKGKESITGIIYEPWHYRYVGVENANKMNSQGVCLEEYVGISS